MKECINCGYVRQPKDDEQGFVPRTECPRCGAIYEKMEKLKESNIGAVHPERSKETDGKRTQQDNRSSMGARKSGSAFVYLIIIAICASAGYYYYANKQKESLSIAQVKVRMFTTAKWPFVRQAKEFLSQKKIDYEEIDINQDRSGKAELIKLTGREGVPTIDIEGEILEGWGPGAGQRVEQTILEHAKAKR